jgi:hypothetical protein
MQTSLCVSSTTYRFGVWFEPLHRPNSALERKVELHRREARPPLTAPRGSLGAIVNVCVEETTLQTAFDNSSQLCCLLSRQTRRTRALVNQEARYLVGDQLDALLHLALVRIARLHV